eukprot:261070-Amphidinium_carterae.1
MELLSTWVDLTKKSSSSNKHASSDKTTSRGSDASGTVQGPGIASLLAMTKTARGKTAKTSNTQGAVRSTAFAHEGATNVEQDEEEHVAHASAWEELEVQRQTLDVTQETISEMFNIRIDGGEWQLERTGRSVYGMRCSTKRNTLVNVYCSNFGLKNSQAFELNVHGSYGTVLAAVWRWHVYTHASHWDAASRPEKFPWSTMHEAVLPEELQRELEGISDRSKTRLEAILNMTPPRV